MGLIDRLRRITMGRIEAFLDCVERPEDVLPDIVRQMQAKVKQVTDAEVKSLTALKGANRRRDEAAGRVARLESGAAAAIAAGQDDLARQALAGQIDAEEKRAAAQEEVDRAQAAYDAARDLRMQFQQDVKTLKTRSAEIIARAQAARARQEVIDAMPAGPPDTLLDTIARMEEKVADQEDHLQATDEIARDLRASLADALGDDTTTASTEEVQRRLAELKRKVEG